MLRENEGRTSLLGMSFAFMGLLKLLGLERGMFRRWGMPARDMRGIGAMETAGALMVAYPQTRLVGAMGLSALSAMLLAVEIRNREVELVLPRAAITLVALATAVAAHNATRAPAHIQ